MKRYAIMAAVAVALFLLGYIFGRTHKRNVEVRVQTDTLTVRDTIVVDHPVDVERVVRDSILVAVRDTIRERDTLVMVLQRESRTYKGKDYTAVVSGYDPSLERIEVYPTVTTITRTETVTEKTSPWRFNVVVGVDYGRMEERYVTPNIGAEIGWKRWSVTASAGARMMVMEGNTLAPIPYAEAGVRYRIVAR